MTEPPSASDPPGDATARQPHGDGGESSRRAPWALPRGVTVRLLLTVLLPTAALAVAAGVLLSERYRTAQEARAIAGEIPAVTGIVRLRALLDQERLPAETLLRASELGVPVAGLANALPGVSGGSESAARAAVDAQLRSLHGSVPAAFVTGLYALRLQIDAGRLDAREVDQAFGTLSGLLANAVAARLSLLEARIASTDKAAALDASLRTLSEANDALSAASSEAAAVSDVYFDRPTLRPRDLSALGASIALFERASTQLRDGSAGSMRAAFAQLESSRSWQRFQAGAVAAADGDAQSLGTASTAAGAGVGGLLGDPRLLAKLETLVSGWNGVRRLYGLVALAATGTGQAAAKLRAASTGDFRRLLLLALTGVGLMIALALLLARSISGPLQRLRTYARAVSAGNLDLPPLRPRGPRETVVASQAFNDLVANLRLLEAKMRTLAACMLDDPVLAEPLPGRLGRALQQSVAVLSGSIVEREQLQERLAHQATHDSLTGLHNRAAAIELLEQAIARASRSGRALAVLFIDLDDFKRTNDIYGHPVGDAILVAIAERVSLAARRSDFVARLGSDEFLIVAEGLADAAEAAPIAARVLDALSEPVRAQAISTVVSACIGISFGLDGEADDASQLLARADLALYRAKRAAGSHVEIYDEQLRQEILTRAEVERDLGAALDQGGAGLLLQYQPIIDAASGELVLLEALLRWDRPGHGRCRPDEFIPAAEASGLIVRLDRWVLATVLAQQRQWRRAGLGEIGVAVNISGRHLLSGRLVEHVTEALRSSGARPDRLTLELTETVLLTDLPAIALDLEQLRGLGIRLAIDDFGTGYTSLAHLQHLTVDEIKIDRSYVGELPERRESSLVGLVVEVGHHLGMSVIAEGVETDAQLACLQKIGCDLLQGYAIAPPLDPERFVAWRRTRMAERLGTTLNLAV